MYKAEKKISLMINFARPVGRVLYEFQSSEAKTYLSQTSRWVKFFCPAWASSPFEGFHEKFCGTLIFPPCYNFCMFSCSFCPSFKFKFKFKFKKEWKSYLLTNQIWPCLYFYHWYYPRCYSSLYCCQLFQHDGVQQESSCYFGHCTQMNLMSFS